MARAAVLGRLTWRAVTVAEIREETPVARTLVLDVPDWPGHLAGQHVDVRLTAEDGYTAQRSYSIASRSLMPSVSPSSGGSRPATSRVELTVQAVSDGEVSSYLVGEAQVGDTFEIRGPVGGYFTWQPDQAPPVLLVAGGSGIVPLMAMIRTRGDAASKVPFRLLYSARDPSAVMYVDELVRRARDDQGLDVAYQYTRQGPPQWTRPLGRVNGVSLGESGWPAAFEPSCYVCGPTGFVETVANLLVDAGHKPDCVRTERFGPTGG
jgi:ferredoxin-NADP reductase